MIGNQRAAFGVLLCMVIVGASVASAAASDGPVQGTLGGSISAESDGTGVPAVGDGGSAGDGTMGHDDDAGGLDAVDGIAWHYSRDYGVSVHEAERRLGRIEELKAILGEIRALAGGRVAGWGIDHSGVFGGWVELAGDDPVPGPAAAAAGLHEDVWIRTGAAHTYAELRSAQGGLFVSDDPAAAVELERVSRLVSFTGVDMSANAVRVGVDPDLGGDAAVLPGKTNGDVTTVDADDLFEEVAAEVAAVLRAHVPTRTVVEDGRGILADAVDLQADSGPRSLPDNDDTTGFDGSGSGSGDGPAVPRGAVRGPGDVVVSLRPAYSEDQILLINESDWIVKLRVILSEAVAAPLSGSVVLTHITTDIHDFYTIGEQAWTVPAGETEAVVEILINDDDLNEYDEEARFDLGMLPLGFVASVRSSVKVIIVDTDHARVQMFVPDAAAIEGNSDDPARFEISVTGQLPESDSLVLVPSESTAETFVVRLKDPPAEVALIRVPVDFGSGFVDAIRVARSSSSRRDFVAEVELVARPDADLVDERLNSIEMFDWIFEGYGFARGYREDVAIVVTDTGVAPTVSLAVSSSTVSEGDTAGITVTLNSPQPTDTVVRLRYFGGEATASAVSTNVGGCGASTS